MGALDFDFNDVTAIKLLMNEGIEELSEKTVVVKTGKGYHIYLRDKNGNETKNKSFRNSDPNLSVPIDLKGGGGR
jgi:hypothetical protein